MLPTSGFSKASDLVCHSFHPEIGEIGAGLKDSEKLLGGIRAFLAVPDEEM